MNNDIVLRKLASNPLLAYAISMPETKKLGLTMYEEAAYPAIFGNMTGISMKKVYPLYEMGRVRSFMVEPRYDPDPVIIFSPIGNLKPYYQIWSKVLIEGKAGRYLDKRIEKYDDAIKTFISSISCFGSEILSVHEVTFAIIEMLKFKNDIILNWR